MHRDHATSSRRIDDLDKDLNTRLAQTEANMAGDLAQIDLEIGEVGNRAVLVPGEESQNWQPSYKQGQIKRLPSGREHYRELQLTAFYCPKKETPLFSLSD